MKLFDLANRNFIQAKLSDSAAATRAIASGKNADWILVHHENGEPVSLFRSSVLEHSSPGSTLESVAMNQPYLITVNGELESQEAILHPAFHNIDPGKFAALILNGNEPLGVWEDNNIVKTLDMTAGGVTVFGPGGNQSHGHISILKVTITCRYQEGDIVCLTPNPFSEKPITFPDCLNVKGLSAHRIVGG